MPSINEDRNKDRGRWKALTFDYERVLSQVDLMPTFHCLSAPTVMLLSSMIEFIAWRTRYDVDFGETVDIDLIKSWEENAAYELSGGQMLRQNGCKLEASCDGVNWVTLLDLGSCLLTIPSSSGDAITYENNITEINNDYTGTPGSIGADDVVYDQSGDDVYRDIALCLAIRAWIEAIARTWVEKDQANDSRNRLIATAGVIFATGVLAIMTAGIGLLVAGAVGSAIALIAINLDLEDETQLYSDEVLDDVQCCMYLALAGSTPTEADFQSSAQGCGFDVDSYSEALAEIVDAVNNQGTSQYLAFLKLWNETFEYAENGLIEQECDECDLDWDMYADLAVSALPYGVTMDFGNFVPMLGIQFVCSGGTPQTKEGKARIVPDFSYEQRSLRLDYRYTLGSTSGSSVNQAVFDGTAGGGYSLWKVWQFGEVQTGVGYLENAAADVNVESARLRLRSSRNACNGSGELTGLYVRGTGPNPFLGKAGWVKL